MNPSGNSAEMSAYFYIQSQLNQLVITIDGSKNGGNLVMYPARGGDNQLWKWGPGDSLVSKMGLVAGLGLNYFFDSPPFPCIAGTPGSLEVLNWQYEDDEIKSTILTFPQEYKGAMDIAQGDTKISAVVQRLDSDDSTVNSKTEAAQSSLSSKIGMSGYFYIRSQLNQLVLTIDGFTKGGNLVMYPAYGGANQLWKWGPDYTLVSKMGLVADIKDENESSGASCIGWYPNGGQNQRWLYENGAIKSTMNGLVMEIANGDVNISAFVQMSKEAEDLDQMWNLVLESNF